MEAKRFMLEYLSYKVVSALTYQTFTCSKSTIETLKHQGIKQIKALEEHGKQQVQSNDKQEVQLRWSPGI